MTSLFEIKTKKCSKCGQEKPINQFSKGKESKDGLRNWCKKCCNQYSKEYQANHKEQHNRAQRSYYKLHKEYYYQVNKDWQDSHKEVCKKLHRDWFVSHQEQYKKKKKDWKRNNPELVKAYGKQFYATPKGKALRARVEHKRRATSSDAINDLTAEQWEEIKKSQNYTCLHCGKQEPEIKLTRDHIIPVTAGGGLTKNNVQGLCQSCNARKSKKIDSQGFQNILKGVAR